MSALFLILVLWYYAFMEWSQKQRISYVLVFIALVGVLSALPLYFFLHKEPTCFDKKQNGDEVGVDCGGSCVLYCATQMKPLRIIWTKAFQFAPEHYDVGAYVENPNSAAGIKDAHYTVRIFDTAGQMIAERVGTIEIAPGAVPFLFERNFTLKTSPEKVVIEFDEDYHTQWRKAYSPKSILVTKNQNLKQTDFGPRLDAILVNTDYVNSVNLVTIGVVILDQSRNPIAISRTYVDTISKGSEQNIFFTWPNPFSGVTEGEKLITDIVIMRPAIFEE